VFSDSTSLLPKMASLSRRQWLVLSLAGASFLLHGYVVAITLEMNLLPHVIFTSMYVWTAIHILRGQQAKTRRLLKALSDSSIICRFTPDKQIIAYNKHFADALGYDETELIGLSHALLVTPEVVQSAKYEAFWQRLGEGLPWEGTYERVAKDGTPRWVMGHYVPIRGDSGAVIEVLKVAADVTAQYTARQELQHKNTYLEHAAKILRHDMHSGINTYLPRGIKSLERRLAKDPEAAGRLKLEMPLKLLKEGLEHTQMVYAGVKEFTNLVRKGQKLEMSECDVRLALQSYLATRPYKDQVAVDYLPHLVVNEPLFITALDNLIRNGLKYNDSAAKIVAVTMADDEHLAIVDNGRGLSEAEFKQYSKAYARKEGQKESGSGLGLNIALAIFHEHGFTASAHLGEVSGTVIKVKVQ
jgi:PAS domain S-box-containing protein